MDTDRQRGQELQDRHRQKPSWKDRIRGKSHQRKKSSQARTMVALVLDTGEYHEHRYGGTDMRSKSVKDIQFH